tara:strand:+ start:1191 stop:3407 length:2217 start_codon:yes stop_codon:yes gene_type:complete
MTMTGKTLSATYHGLLKTAGDNVNFSSSPLNIVDGEETSSALYLSNAALGVGVSPTGAAAEIRDGSNPQLKLSFDGSDNTTFQVDTNGDITITPSGDEVLMVDNKKITLGTGKDLSIYHDGSHSYLVHDGTGNLKIGTTASESIDIGHSTSTVTVGDVLAVTDSLTVGTTLGVTGAVTIGGNIDFNSGTIDLSTQTVDVTLNAAVDALNFDSNTLSIDASNNRVGIGDAAPNQALGIVGANAQISIEEDDDEFIRIGVGESEGTAIIGYDDGTKLQIGVYDSPTDATLTPHMTIDSSGNVGLMTDSPAAGLHIAGTNPQLRIGDDDAEDTSIAFMGNGQDYYIGLDDSDDRLHIGTGTTIGSNAIISIAHTNKIGIGQDTPQSDLHILSTDGDNALSADASILILENSGTVGDAGLQLELTGSRVLTMALDDSDSDKFKIYDITNSKNLFTGLTDGSIGIGTDAPDSFVEIETTEGTPLHLDGAADPILKISGNSNDYAEFKVFNSSDADAGLYINHVHSDGEGPNIHFQTAGSTKMFVQGSDGAVGIGTVAPVDGLLNVHSSGTGTSFASNPVVHISSGATYSATMKIGDTTNQEFFLSALGGSSERLGIGGSAEIMTFLESNQSVGIGTTSPDTKLEVQGTGDPSLHIQINAQSLTNTDVASFKVKGSNGVIVNESEIGVMDCDGSTTNQPVGFIKLDASNGTSYYLWVDDTGDLRISSTSTHPGSTNGTVVGAQS